MPGLLEVLFHILCIAWLRDLKWETFVYLTQGRKDLLIDLLDEYIFALFKGF